MMCSLAVLGFESAGLSYACPIYPIRRNICTQRLTGFTSTAPVMGACEFCDLYRYHQERQPAPDHLDD